MEHPRVRRLSQLMVFIAAMAIAIGIYVAGTSTGSPGNGPSGTVQPQSSSVITSASDNEVAIEGGAQQIQGDTTVNQSDTHESDRYEPRESGNDD